MTTIRNGRVVRGTELVAGDVHFRRGMVVTEGTDDVVIDATGLIVSPGLIDIQINGGFGLDFTQDPTTIWEVGTRLPELGVTSFVPTVVTSPDAVTDLAIDVVTQRRPEGYRGADVLGLHFEGPWISPEMHGAHNVAHVVDPDTEVARRWADCGVVRLVTLAPERPGAPEVVEILSGAGVVVSVGHSAASFETARDALHNGASLVTHLFNQMSPLGHREPGVVGAGLLDAAFALLIVDGLHIAGGAVELAWRMLGPDRTILVTDAMAALGLGPGTYPLGDGPITVGDNGPRTADGRLAGSTVTLPEAAHNLHIATGAGIGAVLATVTANPARAIGLSDRGTLAPGSRADIALFDDELRVVETILSDPDTPDP